jgi:hypothetical protein
MTFTNQEVAVIVANELNRHDRGLWFYRVEWHIDDGRWITVRVSCKLNLSNASINGLPPPSRCALPPRGKSTAPPWRRLQRPSLSSHGQRGLRGVQAALCAARAVKSAGAARAARLRFVHACDSLHLAQSPFASRRAFSIAMSARTISHSTSSILPSLAALTPRAS